MTHRGPAGVAISERMVNHTSLSKDQIDLIQQFEADFNAIEDSLRNALGIDSHIPFTQLVRKYGDQHVRWKDAEFLRSIARIRNVIVHEKREPYSHVVIPAPAIVEELRNCRERLLNPARALPTFQRTVETISGKDSLTRVLSVIHQRDYSQFPVYEEGRFRGLLTENGVTRWLSKCVAESIALLDLRQISALHVLQSEEQRENCHFVSGNMPVDAVSNLFTKFPLLEAALVTLSGEESEELLGIATRWDMLQLE